MPYCKKCGSECIEEWTGEYNTETGQKEMRQVCSKNPCSHNFHDYIKVNDIYCQGTLLFSDYEYGERCKRCGHERVGEVFI